MPDCEKYNCDLPDGHEGWHVKKAKHGKVIIKWLDGQWESPLDGGHGTYSYQDPDPVSTEVLVQDVDSALYTEAQWA